MYCANCGEKLNDNDRVCPACGTPVPGRTEQTNYQDYSSQAQGAPHNGQQTYSYNSANQQTYQYTGPEYEGSVDSGSAGWGILGCCIPLVGLILFLVWKDNKPKSAKAAGIGALIGVIALILIYVILILVMGLSVGALGVGIAEGDIDLSELEDFLEENTSTLLNLLGL